MIAPLPPLRSFGSVTRQVVWPAEVPSLVTVSVTASPAPSADHVRDLGRERADARRPSSGPGARARRSRCSTAMNTVPWTCDADESRRPSGLHRSHSPTSSGTGAPHRTHGWVIGVGAGRGACRHRREFGGGHAPMVTRNRGGGSERDGSAPDPRRRPYQRPAALHERVDVGGRPGQRRSRRRRRPRCQRAHVSRGAVDPRRPLIVSSREPLPLEPDVDPLVLAPLARPPPAPRGRAAGSPRSCPRTPSSHRRSGPPGAPRPASRRR